MAAHRASRGKNEGTYKPFEGRKTFPQDNGDPMKHFIVTVLALFLGTSFSFSQSTPATGQPFVVEYYYRAKWGHADEFLRLFKKNHYPLLKK